MRVVRAVMPGTEGGGRGMTGQRDEVSLSPRKFEAARQPRTAITRSRLLDAIARTPDARVVLLSAPAGSGKTVLLEQWVAGLRRPEWAWVSLDAADEDPARFWSCVAEAILRGGHDPAEHTLAALAEGLDPAALASAVAADMADAPGLRVLVLDDFHLAASTQIEAGVAILAELLPPGVRLAVGTRSDPKLPLHRWRLRGELCEMRAVDLRFRDEEADRLFTGGHGLAIGPEDRGRLVSYTEGWAAGLQLAALSLRDGPGVPDLLDRFAATHQPLLDFLATEVLDRQPRWRRRFLQGAACVGEFCPAVLNQVLDRDDSHELLRDVRADNLFLVPLDHLPGWYRFHHLFGQFLRFDLHAVDPAREVELHRRAGDWMRRNGRPALAVDHLLAGGDLAEALEVVDERVVPYFDRGRRATIRRWIERFPEEFLAADPRRCVLAGTAWLAAGDTGRALRWLGRWAEFPPGDAALTARAHALAVPTRLFVGDLDGCVGTVEPMQKGLAATPWLPFATARLLPFAAMAHLLRGEFDEARGLLDRAAADPRADATTRDVLIPGIRSLVALGEGRLREAGELAARSGVVEQGGEAARPHAIFGALTRAALAVEHGDFDTADMVAERERLSATQVGNWSAAVLAHLVLAYANHARDDAARALDHVEQAGSFVRRFQMGAPIVAWVDHAEARVRLALGEVDRAAALVAGLPGRRRELVEARVRVARGDDRGAYAVLAEGAGTWPLPLRIEREVVLACAAARSEPRRAEHHIDEALALGEAEGYRHTILGEGAGPRGRDIVRDLVVGAVGRSHSRYAAQLARAAEPAIELRPAGARPWTAARAAPGVTLSLVEPLTPAEQRVLFYLASSLTVAELARQFGVSPNTVKTQMKSIYRKLEVGSRDAATERARALGLR